MNTPEKFNTREEAVQHLIIDPMDARGVVEDARDARAGEHDVDFEDRTQYETNADAYVEYDMDAIADAVLTLDEDGRFRAADDFLDDRACVDWDFLRGVVGDNVRPVTIDPT